MINKYLLFFECIIILSSGLSLPVKIQILCKPNCSNMYINNISLNLKTQNPQTTYEEFQTKIDLKEDEIETFSVEVYGIISEGEISASLKIGQFMYSTNIIDSWGANLPGYLNIIFDKRYYLAVCLRNKNSINTYGIYTYTLKIPNLIKIKDFYIKVKKNQDFYFPFEKYSNIDEERRKIKKLFFVKIPKNGIICYVYPNSCIKNPVFSFGVANVRDFKYIKLSEEEVIDTATLYVRDEDNFFSNEFVVTFIYCYDDTSNNEICIDGCPENYIFSNNACIEKGILEKKLKGISYADQKVDEFKDNLKETFKAYKELGVKISGDNYFFEIISSFNRRNEDGSLINFTECEGILKEEYGIDEVYIGKIDIENPNQITQVEYMAFDEYGEKLDLAYCKGKKITVEVPLKSNAEIISKLYEKGINPFDGNSAFFNDLCFPYNSKEGDVTLKDRRDLYYQGDKIEKGCSYSSFNEGKVKLECDMKTDVSSKRELNAPVFKNELLASTNMVLVTCYNTLTIKNLAKTNYGLWLCVSIFLVQLVLFLYFVCCGYKSLVLKVICGAPLGNPSMRMGFFTDGSNSTPKSSESRLAQQSRIKSTKSKKSLSEFLKNITFNKAVSSKNPFKFCWLLILVKIKLYTIIYTPGLFDVISLSLSIFLSSFILDFLFNALFFSDDIISKKLQNGGKIKTSTKLLLPILSNITGSIVSGVFLSLEKTLSTLELLRDEKYKKEKSDRVHNEYLRLLKRRIIMYYIMQLFILVFIGYYLTVFCIVYPGSQLNWLIDCLTGILLSGVCLVVGCFIISLIRSLALHFKFKPIYQGLGYLGRLN